ncbi:MAG: nucleotidyltransferase domain-containing protein [Candidatus Omnitrophota bacterium]|jgi:predicted nucleotidyltransferase
MKKDTFSSTITQKILDFLCDHLQESFFSAQIAFETSLSKGGVNQALRKLAQEGFLKAEKKGRMIFYQVEARSPVVKQYKILKNVSLLQPLVERLKALSERVVLFGSSAFGEDTGQSDIDIYVVSGNAQAVKDLVILRSPFKRKAQLVLKTPAQDIALDKKEPVFYNEVKKGIVLWQKQ